MGGILSGGTTIATFSSKENTMINLGGIFSYIFTKKCVSLGMGEKEMKWDLLDMFFLWIFGKSAIDQGNREVERVVNEFNAMRVREKAETITRLAPWSKKNVSKTGIRFQDVCKLKDTFASKKGVVVMEGTDVTVEFIHADGVQLRVVSYYPRTHLEVPDNMVERKYNDLEEEIKRRGSDSAEWDRPKRKRFLLGDYGRREQANGWTDHFELLIRDNNDDKRGWYLPEDLMKAIPKEILALDRFRTEKVEWDAPAYITAPLDNYKPN